VGRFVPDKGIASLIDGFALSLAEFPDNRLQTIGPQTSAAGASTAFFQKMVQHVKRHGLGNRISFTEPIFDKQRLDSKFMEADVICVPSLSGETFSMAILEAMALGKPVLVSDFSPMPEAVDHKTTGYVARAGDAESIAEGIRFFSRRPESLHQIGAAGFHKAQRCFSVERIAAEYLEDFEALIDAKRNAAGAVAALV
jgi:glycosyltransferase involved in cell wall biosynthesis